MNSCATPTHFLLSHFCCPPPGIALQDAPSPKRSGVPLRLRQGWLFRSFQDLPERRKQGR